MKANNIAISEIIIAIGLLIVISVFQVIYILTTNIEILTIANVAPYALLFIGISIAVSAILFFILKSPSSASFWGCVFIMLFINFRHIENLAILAFPQIRFWHFMLIILYFYSLLLFLGVKIIPKDIYKKMCLFLLIPFGLLTLINIFMAVPSMVEQVQDRESTPQTTEATQTIGQTDRPNDLPNIYYFIFDEYGGFEVMENLYEYLNSTFYTFLNNNNFEVSRSSRNSTTQTIRIMTNLLNLDYIDEGYDVVELRGPLREGPHALLTLLESFGYNIRGVGSTGFLSVFSESNAIQNTPETRTIDGQDIETLLLSNTMIYPFFHRALTGDHGEIVLNAFEFMNNIENIPSEQTFTLFYVVSPHSPFVFDRNGNAVSARNFNNWADPQFYLGQFQYITRLATQTVEFILEHDPDSIIILQSDHGPRSFGGTFEDRTNILNAVYFRGEPITEINGLSGVNTLRVVMSRLLDLDMPVLEVPQR